VVDANAGGSVLVTVSSPGTGDIEIVALSLVSGPLYSGPLTFSTVSGVGNNNGVLFVLPNETVTVSYSDSSPVGVTTSTAAIACSAGDVVYVTNTQFSDNGDNDGLPDNNECVTMDVTIQNNLGTQLTNAKVTIVSNSPNVDLIPDDHAVYGTVNAGATATNPASDRFTFHVASAVQCSDPANPPTAKFTVLITADGLNGAQVLQTFTLGLDLDVGGGTTSYTQNFAVDPGWTTGVTAPDNAGCSANPYANDFHWCALCGNAGGGYGAWVGNQAFGTSGQNYTSPWNSSTLYSPVFVAGGASVSLQFRTGFRTEPTFDGAIVQYQLGAGPWTTLGYTSPAQSATTTVASCSPILAATPAWTGTGTLSALTNAASVATTNGQKIGFRWRLGGDSGVNGATFGGFNVDDVTVTGLRVFLCEPTRNTGLAPCTYCTFNANGSSCDDANGCTASDVCSAGSCVGTANPVPDEAQNLRVAADKTTYSYDALPRLVVSDWTRGGLNAFPVGPGGGDETCFGNQSGLTLADGTVPSPGTGFWYLVRGENACGTGTYGFQGVNGVPGAQRVTTTCP
jgi:hypothetical protein